MSKNEVKLSNNPNHSLLTPEQVEAIRQSDAEVQARLNGLANNWNAQQDEKREATTSNTQKIWNTIKAPYELAEHEAWKKLEFARKYGKKSEQKNAQTQWAIAHAVVVAVDCALFEAHALALSEALTK